MADIYGANLYNRYLHTSHSTKAQMQAKSGERGADSEADADDGDSSATSADGAEVARPESCRSILVCTGVYSRDQEELPSDPSQTVTEQRIFHGHRDFSFDPSLTQPSFVVQDVKEAVELVFQEEGWPLD